MTPGQPPHPHVAFRQCDGRRFRRMAEAALTWLETNHRLINALNVFPVPDGDTGTNMLLTMQAAWKEIADSREHSVSKMAHALAHGALMGARGNSGVILSQIWRGFARGLDNVEAFDADGLVNALQVASETAYRGVGKPVEGTILTVIREAAAGVAQARPQSDDLRFLLEQMLAAANAAVARTPELLPVLKQAGVVDAGGKGLATVLEGMVRSLAGLPLDIPIEQAITMIDRDLVGAVMDAVEPGQEWETVVDFRPHAPLHLPALYGRLETLGTSIQVGEGDGVYRVHIHLLKSKRYAPIELAEELGTVTNVHMENLLDQLATPVGGAPAVPLAQVEPGQIGVVVVSPGAGLSRIFASLGAAGIVSGGQTMNPSTQDLLQAVGRIPAGRVILLPNNKNIILAARQAAELSDKQLAVVPTRAVPQGIAALLRYERDGDLEAVCAAMEDAAGEVECGEVTQATRTVELDSVAVAEGQYIGLHNGTLKVSGDDLLSVVLGLLEAMGAARRELLSLYSGSDLRPEQVQAHVAQVRAAYPGQQVEHHLGGQPHYHYIISAE